jgi:hypothetical protein
MLQSFCSQPKLLSTDVTQNVGDRLFAYKASQLEAKTKIKNRRFSFLIKVPDNPLSGSWAS